MSTLAYTIKVYIVVMILQLTQLKRLLFDVMAIWHN